MEFFIDYLDVDTAVVTFRMFKIVLMERGAHCSKVLKLSTTKYHRYMIT